FLLVREKAGHWGLPKGHPSKGESEIETARREFTEETGIVDPQIIEGPSFLERYHIGNEKKIEKTVTYFIARINEIKVTIQPDEIIGYGWFNYEDALNIATHEDTKRIIREANEYADKHFEKTL
ncbi:MAG: NUDIX domain-containing protein, partial [Candidatus Yonathbacteria bacterium]|nr:NUDIX domain-containing protein [Candidatus Yonathbacteria bacterium]